MCSEALRAVRRLSRIPVKIYTWIAGMLSFMLYPFSPESYGGRGDYRERIMHEVKRTGRCFEEVADEVGPVTLSESISRESNYVETRS